MALITVIGELLSIGVLIMGLAGFLQFYMRTRFRPHLAMLVPVVIVLSSMAWLFSALEEANIEAIRRLLLLQAFGFPFYVYWGEQNRRRVEAIAATGEFDPGFPLPSGTIIKFRFFGQLFEDLAKPVVLLEGSRPLNRMVKQLSEEHPILRGASFSRRGEFKLSKDMTIQYGSLSFDAEGFSKLCNMLIDEYAKVSNIKGQKELQTALQEKCGQTISKYMDFLIDEGLLHSLARGLLTEKASTGFKELDKALGGGYARGEVVLLVGDSSASTRIAESFILAGLDLGEGCVFVTASKPPAHVQRALSGAGGSLKIVDCYTARHTEVQTLRVEGNVFVSPVDLSVVDVAISRALASLGDRRKRAVVDVLSAYVTATQIHRIYHDILEIINEFRKHGCTAVFLFNPAVAEEDTRTLAIEELFDSVIRLRTDASGKPILDVDKMALGQRMAGLRVLRGLAVETEAPTA